MTQPTNTDNNGYYSYYSTVKLTLPLLYKLLMWANSDDTDEYDIYKMLEKLNSYGYLKEYLSIDDLESIKGQGNCIPVEPPVEPVPSPAPELYKTRTPYR